MLNIMFKKEILNVTLDCFKKHLNKLRGDPTLKILFWFLSLSLSLSLSTQW